MEKQYRLLYPMGVYLIGSSYAGKDNVMSAAWCFPLSIEPPLFGVSVGKGRFSYGMIDKSREFVINIPSETMKDAVLICGKNSGADSDKFALAKITKEKSKKVTTPSIAESMVSIECKVVDSKEAGDHVLFIGKPVNITRRKQGKRIMQTEEGELMVY